MALCELRYRLRDDDSDNQAPAPLITPSLVASSLVALSGAEAALPQSRVLKTTPERRALLYCDL